MRISIDKNIFLEKLSYANRFSMSKISSLPVLQGVFLRFNKEKLEIISTNLNDFFYSYFSVASKEKREIVVDGKKIVEFLSFVLDPKIDVEIEENRMVVNGKKSQGVFEVSSASDFPPLPKTTGKKTVFDEKTIKEKIPLLIFAAAKDENRPVLTGVNFTIKDGQEYMVATDGFRLSLFYGEKKEDFSPMIVSASLLTEITRLYKKGNINLIFSEENKTVSFELEKENILIISRAIEGEFPPFEKVIPKEARTSVVLDREEFLRNIKQISIFARDQSNIVFFDIKKNGIYFRPKNKGEKETHVFQEGKVVGEEQKVAFNYKFIIDFLLNTKTKEIVFEMNQPFSPCLFKSPEIEGFLHVIMPIRVDEEG